MLFLIKSVCFNGVYSEKHSLSNSCIFMQTITGKDHLSYDHLLGDQQNKMLFLPEYTKLLKIKNIRNIFDLSNN